MRFRRVITGIIVVVLFVPSASAQEISDYLGVWYEPPINPTLPAPIAELSIADHEAFHSVLVFLGDSESLEEGVRTFGSYSGWGVITWRRDDDGELLGGSAVVDNLEYEMHHYLWMTLDGDQLYVSHRKTFMSEEGRTAYFDQYRFPMYFEDWEFQRLDQHSTSSRYDGPFDW